MKKLSCLLVFTWLAFASVVGFTAESTASKTPVILVLGDSLSASFGIDQSIGWASLLEHKLTLHNYNYRVVNASISGETTQGGLQRLPGLLAKYQPRLVILELGGNDGLRGLSIDMISTNLQTMISKTRGFPADILLLGMRLPPNYGAFYTERFQQMYVDLGTANNIPVVPFLLKGIATREDLMQADGIHPKAQAQPLVLENVWEILKPRLTQTQELTEQQTQ